ncbi:hypothetical protein STENM223S_04694 [Streptomyces tendae]
MAAVLADGRADPPPRPGRRPRHGLRSRPGPPCPRLLDEEFGRRGVVPASRTSTSPRRSRTSRHRRFLRETGLPEDGFLFSLDTDQPLRTLTATPAGVQAPAASRPTNASVRRSAA